MIFAVKKKEDEYNDKNRRKYFQNTLLFYPKKPDAIAMIFVVLIVPGCPRRAGIRRFEGIRCY